MGEKRLLKKLFLICGVLFISVCFFPFPERVYKCDDNNTLFFYHTGGGGGYSVYEGVWIYNNGTLRYLCDNLGQEFSLKLYREQMEKINQFIKPGKYSPVMTCLFRKMYDYFKNFHYSPYFSSRYISIEIRNKNGRLIRINDNGIFSYVKQELCKLSRKKLKITGKQLLKKWPLNGINVQRWPIEKVKLSQIQEEVLIISDEEYAEIRKLNIYTPYLFVFENELKPGAIIYSLELSVDIKDSLAPTFCY